MIKELFDVNLGVSATMRKPFTDNKEEILFFDFSNCFKSTHQAETHNLVRLSKNLIKLRDDCNQPGDGRKKNDNKKWSTTKNVINRFSVPLNLRIR